MWHVPASVIGSTPYASQQLGQQGLAAGAGLYEWCVKAYDSLLQHYSLQSQDW